MTTFSDQPKMAKAAESECESHLAQAAVAFAKSDQYHSVRTEYTLETAQYLLRLTGVFTEDNDVLSHKVDVTILELGCGTGLLTDAMMKALEVKNVRYIATDPTPSMADVFRKNYPNVEFMACAAENIPLPDNSVDVVLGAASFHWFPNQQAYNEMYRVVRPTGKLCYIVYDLLPEMDGPEWCKPVHKLVWEAYTKSGAPWNRDYKRRDALLASNLFCNYTEDFSQRYFHALDAEMAVQSFASWARVSSGTVDDQEMFVRKLSGVIDEYFTQKGVEFTGVPYVAEIYHCQTTKTKSATNDTA